MNGKNRWPVALLSVGVGSALLLWLFGKSSAASPSTSTTSPQAPLPGSSARLQTQEDANNFYLAPGNSYRITLIVKYPIAAKDLQQNKTDYLTTAVLNALQGFGILAPTPLERGFSLTGSSDAIMWQGTVRVTQLSPLVSQGPQALPKSSSWAATRPPSDSASGDANVLHVQNLGVV